MPIPDPLIWNSPGKDASDSMPLGNGDMGLNAWVEEGGDLLFYLSKTDAWDENARLLKLARVRVAFDPNPFGQPDRFQQRLDPATGTLTVRAESNDQTLELRLWVDAHKPVVRLEATATVPTLLTVRLELWRTEARERLAHELHGAAGLRSAAETETVYPDTLLDAGPRNLAWCHHNRHSCWRATLEHQDMGAWLEAGETEDPLLKRTFGALIRGAGMSRVDEKTLRSDEPSLKHTVGIHPLTRISETPGDWLAAVRSQADQEDESGLVADYARHCEWWKHFWERSWIHITGTPEAETVSRGYALQRFVTACAGRGAFPIKFNGSLFTVEGEDGNLPVDADYRRWGGGYWFQNTRLAYWPMIMAGDFDLMEPWFQLFLNALPLARARAESCLGINEAAYFPETMTFWGTFLNENYGYQRGDSDQPGLSQNRYIQRYWQGLLELLAILLDAYAVSRDERLLRDKILVLAPPFLRFYREFYSRREADGSMRLEPSQSLETWHEAVNPSPDIAGLRWVLEGLLKLPEGALPADLRREWADLLSIVPAIPTRVYHWKKKEEVIPALQYNLCFNMENPELYTVFPYRFFTYGKTGLDTGKHTYENRMFKDTPGWGQDAIQAAMLGLTDEAAARVSQLFSTPNKDSRFPAFWGPNFDWTPDQDHGGVACIALQRMLMQWDDGLIHLLPSWPKTWTVYFRLHAPGGTVVEGHAENGVLSDLKVTPETYRAAIQTGAVIFKQVPGRA